MKLLLPFLSLLLLSLLPEAAAATDAAPAPAKKDATAKPGAPEPAAASAAAAAPAPAAPAVPAAPASTFTFAKYLDALKTGLKLSDDEQKQVQAFYLADGPTLQNILNDGSLSPLQQAQKVSDLRDARNGKIEALLENSDERRREFMAIEAQYRVALTELAADGGLVAPPAPAAAK